MKFTIRSSVLIACSQTKYLENIETLLKEKKCVFKTPYTHFRTQKRKYYRGPRLQVQLRSEEKTEKPKHAQSNIIQGRKAKLSEIICFESQKSKIKFAQISIFKIRSFGYIKNTKYVI